MLNLDTHILLFALSGQVTAAERKILSADDWSISAIVLWEIARLAELRRISVDLEDREVARLLSRIHTWPIDLAVCRHLRLLDVRGDPADDFNRRHEPGAPGAPRHQRQAATTVEEGAARAIRSRHAVAESPARRRLPRRLDCRRRAGTAAAPPPAQLAANYVPPPDDAAWARRDPAAAGFDPVKLEAAVEFARTHETERPRDYSDQQRIFGTPLGPLPAAARRHQRPHPPRRRHRRRVRRHRGGGAGLQRRQEHALDAARRGARPRAHQGHRRPRRRPGQGRRLRLAAEPGHHVAPPRHADQRVGRARSSASRTPSSASRSSARARASRASCRRRARYYEYNDVRVNRFAISLLRVWKRPLPRGVPRRGDDADRRQHDVAVDSLSGRRRGRGRPEVPTVSGGTRWGGGVWMNSRDAARFGLLFLRRGQWGSRTVISSDVGARRDDAQRAEGRLRLPVVAQHGAEAVAVNAGQRRLPPSALAATRSGSIPNTTWSSSGGGTRATAPSSSPRRRGAAASGCASFTGTVTENGCDCGGKHTLSSHAW